MTSPRLRGESGPPDSAGGRRGDRADVMIAAVDSGMDIDSWQPRRGDAVEGEKEEDDDEGGRRRRKRRKGRKRRRRRRVNG